MMKKSIFLGIILFSLLGPGLALAWEIEYPSLPGAAPPTDFPSLVNYIYHFSLYVAALIALVSMMWAGIQRLVSQGSPEALFLANEQMTAGFWALIILLSSFVVLYTLNPKTAIFGLPKLAPTLTPTSIPAWNIMRPADDYWEIPLGKNSTWILQDANDVRAASKKVKDLTIYVDNLINTSGTGLVAELKGLQGCDCSRITSRCTPETSPDNCPNNNCLGLCRWVGQLQTDLCPLWSQITIDRADLNNYLLATGQRSLFLARNDLLDKKFELEKEQTRLLAIESLIRNCSVPPTSQADMASLLEEQGSQIRIRKPWPAIDIENDPATLYCPLDENFVNSLLIEFQSRIYLLMAERNAEQSGLPLPNPQPAPAPGPLPPPVTPPPPGTSYETFPLRWPVASPNITQCFDAPTGYGSHEGIDLSGNIGDAVYPAADGWVEAIGDLRPACSNGSLGIWMAVRHQIQQGANVFTAYTIYAHLNQINVSLGSFVTRNTPIAQLGNTGFSTGPHLHFSYYSTLAMVARDDCKLDPSYPSGAPYPAGADLDPLDYLIDNSAKAACRGGAITGKIIAGFPDYRQKIDPWQNIIIDSCQAVSCPNGRDCNDMFSSGCGVASLAMVLRYFDIKINNVDANPTNVAAIMDSSSYACCTGPSGCGTIIWYDPPGAPPPIGITVKAASLGLGFKKVSLSEIDYEIEQNHPVIAGCGKFPNASGAHVTVIKGYGINPNTLIFQDTVSGEISIRKDEISNPASTVAYCDTFYAFYKP